MPLDNTTAPLIDSFGRKVTYLRLSVTDRCDLRCTYCMAEKMTFLPKRDVLSLEELARLTDLFIRHGIRKLRHADTLAACGVRRVNVSLDTLDAGRYRNLTRLGDINSVLSGIDAAQAAGLKVKLNAVASRGAFEAEVDSLIRFAHTHGADLTLIEEMPLGDTGLDRDATVLSLRGLREDLARRWTMTPTTKASGGPAHYVRLAETGGLLGSSRRCRATFARYATGCASAARAPAAL